MKKSCIYCKKFPLFITTLSFNQMWKEVVKCLKCRNLNQENCADLQLGPSSSNSCSIRDQEFKHVSMTYKLGFTKGYFR